MGKKKGGKGGDGEKVAAAGQGGGEEKKLAAEQGGGGKKKEDGPITVVMKVDMHCEGCAKKVKRSVNGFEGVEEVKADLGDGKLTVVGKVDPWSLRDRVESKTRKKVVLVSPTNLPKKDAAAKDEKKGGGGGGGGGNGKAEKKPDEKKPKEPASSTVVLKIRLHCEGCIQRIRKTISRIKGVENVSVDSLKDLITVTGVMDVKTLPDYLKAKLKRGVEIVTPPKKEGGGGGGDKKEKGGGGGGGRGEGGKKEKGGGGGDGGGEKKGKEGGGGEKKEGGGGGGGANVLPEVNKMDYYGYGGMGGYPPYAPYGYRVEMIHAPQIFSDENPNACSIM